jgi:hypothetical protein
LGLACENAVMCPQVALAPAEEQPPGADLDVVRVRADREHGQRLT